MRRLSFVFVTVIPFVTSAMLISPGARAQDGPPAPASASAGRGSLGIRASFGGGTVPVYSPLPGSAANAPSSVGTIGLGYFVSDRTKLTGEVGAGVALAGGSPRVGFSAGFGADYLLRDPTRALRPLLHAGFAFDRGPPNEPNNSGQDLPALLVDVGGGAEYFFAREFSISCRVGLGLAWRFGLGAPAPGGGVISIGTILPSVGATWYL